jgi:hypothetical protein
MKTHTQRSLLFLFSVILLLLVAAPDMRAQPDRAVVEVLLVKAGDGNGGVDRALRPYTGTLQRLFRFDSYRLIGRGTLTVAPGGEAQASFPGGQSLLLKAGRSGKRGLPAEIHWKRGGANLVHTRINLGSGSPAVLGGPQGEDGAWLMILRLR